MRRSVKPSPFSPATPVLLLLLLQLSGCSAGGRGRNAEGPVGLEKEKSLESWNEGAVLELLINSGLDMGVTLVPSAPKSSVALQSSGWFDGETRSLSVGRM